MSALWGRFRLGLLGFRGLIGKAWRFGRQASEETRSQCVLLVPWGVDGSRPWGFLFGWKGYQLLFSPPSLA